MHDCARFEMSIQRIKLTSIAAGRISIWEVWPEIGSIGILITNPFLLHAFWGALSLSDSLSIKINGFGGADVGLFRWGGSPVLVASAQVEPKNG